MFETLWGITCVQYVWSVSKGLSTPTTCSTRIKDADLGIRHARGHIVSNLQRLKIDWGGLTAVGLRTKAKTSNYSKSQFKKSINFRIDNYET